MKKLNERENFKAYSLWVSTQSTHADREVEIFLSQEMSFRPWLKLAREALKISQTEMARRLNICRSAYTKFETREGSGDIAIKNLCRLAEAMDCEVIYAIRPKSRLKFSQVIWRELSSQAIKHPWVISRPECRKAQALAAAATWMDQKNRSPKKAKLETNIK